MSHSPIPLARPWLGEKEKQRVSAVLDSLWLVQGQEVAAFEAAFAERCGRQHAVAVSSGTAALHIALLSLGIGPGDEVICPNFTWPSPAHATAFLGAIPVLVDVREDDWNLCPESLAQAIGPRTRAIIVVDQFGNPARAAEIEALAGDIPIVEDAACAIGSVFPDGRPCGKLGAISCFSFHPRKVVTTGEGGMCLSDDSALVAKLRALRNHGQDEQRRFVLPSINYRMAETAAALGNVQLERLPEILKRNRLVKHRYQEALPQLAFQHAMPGAVENVQTVGALLPSELASKRPGSEMRDLLIAGARDAGVALSILSLTLHDMPSLDEARKPGAPYPVASALRDRGFALPCFPTLQEHEQRRVIEVLHHQLVELAAG